MKRFQGSLKIYKWWNSQLPLMLVVVYYQLLLATPPPPPGTFLLAMGLFLIATIGIASFGQLLNDLFDVEQDERSGATNLVARRSRPKVILRFLLVLLMGGLPWLKLPTTLPILVLLALEYALFIAYSAPPLRLKNRDIWGSMADALYGYTVPMSVSMLLFARLGHVMVSPWLLALMIAWSFLRGISGILTHQLQDASRDQLAKIRTAVTVYGWNRIFVFMERILLPTEAVVFLLFLLCMGLYAPLLPIGFMVYAAWMFYRWKTFGIWQTGNPNRLPAIDRLFFCEVVVMDRFNTEWLPVLILVALAIHSPVYILLLFLHLYLIQNGIVVFMRNNIPEMRRLRRLV